jgi:hypothetical protein
MAHSFYPGRRRTERQNKRHPWERLKVLRSYGFLDFVLVFKRHSQIAVSNVLHLA